MKFHILNVAVDNDYSNENCKNTAQKVVSEQFKIEIHTCKTTFRVTLVFFDETAFPTNFFIAS